MFNNPMNVFNALQQAMSNPMQTLASMGFGQDVIRNPQQAVFSLINNGKMSQQQFNNYWQIAKQFEQLNMAAPQAQVPPWFNRGIR